MSTMNPSDNYDVLIIGGGPAGLTAATYARRAGKRVLILEKAVFGGQITWSPKVENFPGRIAVTGTELGDALLEQAMEQGAEVELEEAVSLQKEETFFKAYTASGAEFSARSVIIATGAKPRKMGVSREEELTGSGVCYCAVCDGAFFKGQDVAVCGGGNSALQDALFLSELCRKVTVIHRRETFRGEARLVEALRARKNVDFLLGAKVLSLQGEGELSGVVLEQAGQKIALEVSGVFVAIGHEPDNGAFQDLLTLDDAGYAASGEDCITKTHGLFVAGDCRAKTVRQVATAAADGAVAALAACSYLDAQ